MIKLRNKIVFVCVLFSAAGLFAQRQANHTILQDREVACTFKDSIIYTDSFVETVYELTKPARTNLHRRRIESIPEELKRFYDYGHDLKNVMSINSLEGLRVRKAPSLNAEKICSLPYQLNVVLTCLGPEDEIDGIKSAWCEILLPKYLWSGNEPEFGWVFGGYLEDKITTRKNFSINDRPLAYDDEYDLHQHDVSIPYNSLHLYDIINGYTFFDFYSGWQQKKNSERWPKFPTDDVQKKEYYEQERIKSLELLKLTQAGVIPYNNTHYYFEGEAFTQYWDRVQEMRQIHPVNHVGGKLTYDKGTFTDETLELNILKDRLTYTSPIDKSIYTAIIPPEYISDFTVSKDDGLEIYSYETKNTKLPGPLIQMLKKVYENKVMYHYEVFYYSIVDGKLVKFVQIITCSDFMDYYSWMIYGNGESNAVSLNENYISFSHGMNHDDCIYLESISEYPYLKLARDTCNNYDIIQIGPNYQKWN